MTTKISCAYRLEYEKAHEVKDPKVFILMTPSLSQLIKCFWYWLIGKSYCLSHVLSEQEMEEQLQYIKRWYIVTHLRSNKHRAT